MNKNERYLLVLYQEYDDHWDTSGVRRWHVNSYFREEEFAIDEEKELINAIAIFKADYPDGEVNIYKITQSTYDFSKLIKAGEYEAEKIKQLKEQEKRQKDLAQKIADQKAYEARELQELQRLKEKYKGAI